MEVVKKKSKLWYVVPLVTQIFGGVVVYFILRKSDNKLARNCLKVGIINSGIQVSASILGKIFFS